MFEIASKDDSMAVTTPEEAQGGEEVRMPLVYDEHFMQDQQGFVYMDQTAFTALFRSKKQSRTPPVGHIGTKIVFSEITPPIASLLRPGNSCPNSMSTSVDIQKIMTEFIHPTSSKTPRGAVADIETSVFEKKDREPQDEETKRQERKLFLETYLKYIMIDSKNGRWPLMAEEMNNITNSERYTSEKCRCHLKSLKVQYEKKRRRGIAIEEEMENAFGQDFNSESDITQLQLKYLKTQYENKRRKGNELEEEIENSVGQDISPAKSPLYLDELDRGNISASEEPIQGQMESVVADANADGIVPEWRREVIVRKGGLSAGKEDVYYYSPKGQKCRSFTEVERYCKQHRIKVNLSLFKFRMDGSTYLKKTKTAKTLKYLVTKKKSIGYPKGSTKAKKKMVLSGSSLNAPKTLKTLKYVETQKKKRNHTENSTKTENKEGDKSNLETDSSCSLSTGNSSNTVAKDPEQYSVAFKTRVARFTKKDSYEEAALKFGIDESEVRTWRNEYDKGVLNETSATSEKQQKVMENSTVIRRSTSLRGQKASETLQSLEASVKKRVPPKGSTKAKNKEDTNNDGNDGVVPNWSRELIKRKRGRTAGIIDVYYNSPKGKKCRSLNDVEKHVREQGIKVDLGLFEFQVKGQRRH